MRALALFPLAATAPLLGCGSLADVPFGAWFLWGAIAAVGVLLFVVVYLSAFGRTRRALRRAAVVPIAEAREGQRVKLVGRVRAGGPLLSAPLTGRRCVYFTVKLEVNQAGEEENWGPLLEHSAHVDDFGIDDGTGRALVELGRAWFAVPFDEERTAPLKDLPSAVKELLEAHAPSTWRAVASRHLCCLEGALEEGERVAVHGVCRREPDPDLAAEAGYRARPLRVRVCAPPDGNVLVSDDPDTLGPSPDPSRPEG